MAKITITPPFPNHLYNGKQPRNKPTPAQQIAAQLFKEIIDGTPGSKTSTLRPADSRA